MAKKKSKSKNVRKAEPVKKAQKKKTNTVGWVIGAIIVIVIIIAIILLMRGVTKAPVVPTTPTTPAAPAPTETTPSAKPEIVAQGPEEIKACTIRYAIGWPKNKLGNEVCSISGTQVNAQIMYSGKGDSLSGMWFKITTTDGKVQYLKDSTTVKSNETRTYSVDVGQKIEDMLALPIIAIDNVDKACLNQRLLVIKAESCVAG